MRTVKYRRTRGVGNNSASWENTSFDKFVLEAVAARYVNGFVLPPLNFFNEILTNGVPYLQWKPFEIDEDEYHELVELLTTDPDNNITQDNEFDNARSLHDWRMKIAKKYSSVK